MVVKFNTYQQVTNYAQPQEFEISVIQVACVTRLVPQKGVHLIRHSIYRTLEKGGQFILLGSSPFPDIQVIKPVNHQPLSYFWISLSSYHLLGVMTTYYAPEGR